MKVLYLSSCHSVLEYNDLTMFSELGWDWFSTGFYMRPKQIDPFFSRRPAIDKNIDEKLTVAFRKANTEYTPHDIHRKNIKLTSELVAPFDVIFCNSFDHYIIDNWDLIKNKLVIWRTYSDQTPQMERGMKFYVDKGVVPVRGSKFEFNVEDSNPGEIIRCYVDENIFKGWKGFNNRVLSFQNYFKSRRKYETVKQYVNLRDKMPDYQFDVYGAYSSEEKDPLVIEEVTFEKQVSYLKHYGVYFSIGSFPASITYNFIEAWMTGIPVITFGPKIGGAKHEGKPSLYEVPDLIDFGLNGIYSDDLNELKHFIEELLENDDLATKMSVEGREKAIKLFGKKTIKEQWKELIERRI